MILQAPYPTVVTTTILPDPEFNDGDAQRHSIDIKRSMDGTRRTYVKSNARRQLTYSFSMSRMKALELRAFIQAYYRAPILLIDHNESRWLVHFTNNPFEFDVDSRAGGWPGGEMQNIALEFEGEPLQETEPEACE